MFWLSNYVHTKQLNNEVILIYSFVCPRSLVLKCFVYLCVGSQPEYFTEVNKKNEDKYEDAFLIARKKNPFHMITVFSLFIIFSVFFKWRRQLTSYQLWYSKSLWHILYIYYRYYTTPYSNNNLTKTYDLQHFS